MSRKSEKLMMNENDIISQHERMSVFDSMVKHNPKSKGRPIVWISLAAISAVFFGISNLFTGEVSVIGVRGAFITNTGVLVWAVIYIVGVGF